MTVVDAHHHLWDLNVRDQDWITGEALAPLRRNFSITDFHPIAQAAEVTASILVQTITVPEETPEMLALAAENPLIAGVVGWTDLTAPDITDTLARLRELPGGSHLVSIRHQVQSEPDPHWLVRPDVLRGLTAIANAGLAYDLVILPHQLPAATAAVRGGVAALEPWRIDALALTFIDAPGADRAAAFGSAWARLRQLKLAYDPANLFAAARPV